MDDKISEPNIFTSGLKKILQPKIIFPLLAVLLILEAVFILGNNFKNPVSQKASNQPSLQTSFNLLGPQSTVRVGQNFEVKAMLITGRPSSGADLVLKYDPNALEASSSAVSSGKIFADYPLSLVDQKNGVIRVSGVSQKGDYFNGTGLFAIIRFTAKRSGETKLSLEFKKGETKDSNVLDSQTVTDTLENVQDLNLVIQ